MYFKKVFAFVLMVVCFSVTTNVSADNELWQAWLYNDATGQMLLINSEQMVIETVTLPLPAQNFFYPYFVSVSPGGDRVAYVTRNESDHLHLMVYDLLNKSILVYYPLLAPLPGSGTMVGTSLDYGSRSDMFSVDGRFLALAYYSNDNWTLAMFDTQTNTLIQTYTSAMPSNPIGSGAYFLPVPVLLDGNRVYVVAAPVAGDGAFELNSYVWDFASNTLVASQIFRGLEHDIDRRTNEVLYAYRSAQFADRTDEIIGMGVHQNSVQVYSPSINPSSTFAFYKDEINTIDYAHFIENSVRILLRTSEIDGDSFGSYRVVNRLGVFQGVLPYQGVWIYNVFGVRNGFLFNISTEELAPYIPFVQGMNSLAVVYLDTANFQIGANLGIVMYIGDPNQYPRLVWAQDAFPAQAPAPTWAQLGGTVVNNPPVNNQPTPSGQSPSQIGNTPPSQPTPSGQSPSQLGNSSSGVVLGGQARVTTAVQALNVRQTPSTAGTKITELAPLTIVNVIGGPMTSDGFVWWNISVGNTVGWVAEGNATSKFLEPYTGQLPPPPPPVIAIDPSAILPPPTLVSPFDGQVFTLNDINPPGTGTIVPIAMTWSTVMGAGSYYIRIERCEATCNFFYGYYTDTPSHLFDVAQYGYGTYRWSVSTLNQIDVEGAYSEFRTLIYRMN